MENWNVGRTFFGIITAILAIIAGFFGINVLNDPDFGSGGTGAPPVAVPTEVIDPDRIWYEIYFTNPSCPDESERVGGLDEVIAADLDFAEVQIDIAAFDLDSEPIINALIAARQERDLNVRVVVDDEHTPASTINRLRRNGMSVVEDQRGALMHNKFIVIDGRYLWTGSMNFASNGVYCNNNNVVRIDSPRLSSNSI